MSLLLIFLMALASFVLSFVLTHLVRQVALKKNIIDTPNERSSHTIPTPSGGGLAIVISFYGVLIAFFLQQHISSSNFIGLAGLLSIALISFIDDYQPISARYRLLIHVGAAIWACYWLGTISWITPSSMFVQLVLWVTSLFYLVWLLNLYNFMDGIDGIASIEAITVLMSAAAILALDLEAKTATPGLIVLMLLLAIIIVAFLIWNWPPAKVFMGDVGSAF